MREERKELVIDLEKWKDKRGNRGRKMEENGDEEGKRMKEGKTERKQAGER